MVRSPLLVAALTACFVGCSTDDVATVTPPAPDASVPPADAGVPAVTPDAGQIAPDSGIPARMARITLSHDGMPLADSPVVFSDLNGDLLATLRTDSEGVVFGPATEDGMVTTVVPSGQGEGRLASWTGVTDGDDLRFESGRGAARFNGTLQVHLPDFPAGARFASVDVGCADSSFIRSSSVQLELDDSCFDEAGTISVLATVFGRRRSTLGFSVSADITIDQAEGTFDVFLPEWTNEFRDVQIALREVPPDARGVFVSSGPVIGNLWFDSASIFLPISQTITAPELEGELSVARFGEEIGHTVSVQVPFDGVGNSFTTRRFRMPFVAGPMDIILENLLPPITRISADIEADPARPTLSWRIDGDPAGEDALLITLEWQDGNIDRSWTFLALPSASRPFQIPIVPDSLLQLAPTRLSTNLEVSAQIFDAENVPDARTYFDTIGPRRVNTSQIHRLAQAQAESF